MPKNKDLPRGVGLNNVSKTSPYVARYKKGDIELKKYCKTLDEAIKLRKKWEEIYGMPKSKILDKKNLIGKRFGKLIVKDLYGTKNGSRVRECECDCGNKAYATTTNLQSSQVRSCGCLPSGPEHQYDDLTGRKFGKLTAIKYIYTNKNKEAVWECKCDCGNICQVSNPQLKKGMTVQCPECRKSFKKDNGSTMVDTLVDNKINDIQVLRYTDRPSKANTTGFRGVSYHKTRKYYIASLTVKRKTYTKHGFKTAEDAYYKGRLVLENEHLPSRDEIEKFRKEVTGKKKED